MIANFDLKSNMDRFIVTVLIAVGDLLFNLKSNMDRFIEFITIKFHTKLLHLKSNMDRFIALQPLQKSLKK